VRTLYAQTGDYFNLIAMIKMRGGCHHPPRDKALLIRIKKCGFYGLVNFFDPNKAQLLTHCLGHIFNIPLIAGR
jgi:hypothetical protein